jgi:hypothetical protein
MAIKGGIPQQRLDQLFHGPVRPDHAQHSASTDSRTSPATIALAPINAFSALKIDGRAWTGAYTLAAPDAALFGKGDFRVGFLGFGILAERAAERASLKKHHGSNTWAVFPAVPSDFDD